MKQENLTRIANDIMRHAFAVTCNCYSGLYELLFMMGDDTFFMKIDSSMNSYELIVYYNDQELELDSDKGLKLSQQGIDLLHECMTDNEDKPSFDHASEYGVKDSMFI